MNQEFKGELGAVHDWACEQVARTAERLEETGEFPHVTDNGRRRTWPANIYAGRDGDNWSHGKWTGGFWVGLMWLGDQSNEEARFEKGARTYGEMGEPREKGE